MFLYRTLSALVIVPLIIVVTLLGGEWFLAFMILVMTLAGYEYTQLVQRGGAQANIWLIIGFNTLALWLAYRQAVAWLWPALMAFVFTSLVEALVGFERGRDKAVANWAFTVTGGVYLGGASAHIVLLRTMSVTRGDQMVATGLGLTLFGLFSIWAVDTGSYMIGTLLGRHRMFPHLSPGKTWEGYFGGLVCVMAFGVLWPSIVALLQVHTLTSLGGWRDLAICTLIGVLAPLGDFGESMLKRWANVKDSGNLIPGHGGVFDRLDTLLWMAVIVYYCVQWTV